MKWKIDEHSSARKTLDGDRLAAVVDVVVETEEGRDSMDEHAMIWWHRRKLVFVQPEEI